MKLYMARYLVPLLVIATPVAIAHPYDEPLSFRKHFTDDGRVIYSNIEKRCFSSGVLTCIEFHPIWKGGLPSSAVQHREHVGSQVELETVRSESDQ